MIKEKDLIIAGYKKYDQQDPIHRHAEFFMQKKFSDPVGDMFFLNFFYYPPMGFSAGLATGAWMAELISNDPHMTFKIHRPDSIKEAEDKALLFWKSMGCDYYEKNT